jgi:16S rRNA (adenine1518-N6/adenine1519-N6)-dimethyltransferase
MENKSYKQQLLEFGIEPKRSLGQNFLADSGLCVRIAEQCAGQAVGQSVLEIGAGLGALTGPLLEQHCRVVAIETDRRLCAALKTKFSDPLGSGQLTLVEADAREVDLAALLGAMPAPRVFAGNLPYHLSGLLLRHAVDHSALVLRSVFLLQQEVVDRLCASAGSDAYGAP